MPSPRVLGARILQVAGAPELRVDGVPFFIHAAQFDYFRIPRDLWAPSLERYLDLGINTIDLRIPWNWHEVQRGEFDFDGHTNPRRDLRALLELLVQKRLRLIVRPGLAIGDQWRNGGIPDWVLEKPAANAAPVDASLESSDLETPEQPGEPGQPNSPDYLAFMNDAREWLHVLARELAPFSSRHFVRLEMKDPDGKPYVSRISGPLMFVGLDDGEDLPRGMSSSSLPEYFGELQAALTRGGLNAIYFVDAPDLTARGAAPLSGTPAPGARTAVGIAGQWNLKPFSSPNISRFSGPTSPGPPEQSSLAGMDPSDLAFEALALATQPSFPAFLSKFSPTAFAPSDDVDIAQPPPQNLLLASRLWIANGVHGIEYAPLQDTITPAGWSAPAAARYFRWDAPLDLSGNLGARAAGVLRNGRLSTAWGAMLAASHLQADFGIIDLRVGMADASERSSDAARVAQPIENLVRMARIAGYTPELVNPGAQSVERLRRDAVLVLPVPPEQFNFSGLSQTAQKSLVEFVEGGGTLVYFPQRPKGTLLEPLWQGAPPQTADSQQEWSYGQGHVISSSQDLFSPQAMELSAAVRTLASLMEHAGVGHAVERTADESTRDLVVSELVPNEPVASAAGSQVCAEKQLCAAALISVTNLGDNPRTDESFSIVDPQASVAGRPGGKISFEASLPAHDSLLLPIHAPLCSSVSPDEHCSDEVISSGAELLRSERDDKTLELTFYTPIRAIVLLHLDSAPTRVEIDPDIRLETKWNQESKVLEVPLLRGAAPDFLRVMRIRLHYVPHVPEKEDPEKLRRGGFEAGIADAVRFPLAKDYFLPTIPPLVVADKTSGGSFTIANWNHINGIGSLDFNLDGAFHGSGFSRSFSGQEEFSQIRFQPSGSAQEKDAAPEEPIDGLLPGQLEVRRGHERMTGPILFIPMGKGAIAHYRFDFDRDGAKEWVLESPRLRFIVSPEEGGSALALVDKFTNEDLIALGGALVDHFVSPAAGSDSPGKNTSTDRTYTAEWIAEKDGTSLRVKYEDPEGTPPGVRIEKTMRLTAPETIEVNYRVSEMPQSSAATAGGTGAPTAFESSMAVPMETAAEENTQFCWADMPPNQLANISDMHCEPFLPNGGEMHVPEGTARIEIRTRNHPTLAVEWTTGHVFIVQKAFSAQIRFQFPAPAQAEQPVENTLRYTVVSQP